jgi:phosphoglycerate dehydrogenase-like enzyme
MPRQPEIAVVVAPGDDAPQGIDGAVVASDAAELSALLRRAEIVLAWDFRTALLRDAWPADPAVRWIHAGSVGVDALMFDGVVDRDIVVTHARGVFEPPVAEYAIALMLLLVKDLGTTIELQGSRTWRHRETGMLAGGRLVVVGAGAIGGATARLARGLGMDVALVGRTARGAVHGIDELDELLPAADFVVLALPLTAATRAIIGAERLARMPRGARLINVGRGALVDEAALLAALRSGHIAGAGLDVFIDEPLPAGHPFWAMPQVVVSPHMAGDRAGWQQAVVDGFLENLRRWQAREPLLHVVDKAAAR